MTILDRLFLPTLFLVLAILNLVSFSSTGFGFFIYLSQSLQLDPWVLIVVAALASLVIQVLIVGFWGQVAGVARSLPRKLVFLIAAIVMSVISWTPGTGAWSVVLKVDSELAYVATRNNAVDLTDPLNNFAERYSTISRMMTAQAALMARRKVSERDRGVSCDGPAVATGPGPRFRLAERLEIEAGQQAATAEALATAAYEAIDLPQGADDDDMRAVLAAARSVARDPRIFEIRNWAETLLEGFEGTFNDSQSGRDFVCRSQDVVAELSEIVELIDQPVNLPAIAPRAVSDGLDTALRASFGQTSAVVQWLLLGGERPDPETLELTKPAMLAAALVELAIISVSMLIGLAGPGRSPGSPGGNPVTPATRPMLELQVATWQTFHVPGRQELFLVPEDGAPEARAAALVEVARWQMTPMPARLPVDLSVVAPDLQADLAPATGGAKRFRAYRVPRRALTWLRQAVVDLHDSLPLPSA